MHYALAFQQLTHLNLRTIGCTEGRSKEKVFTDKEDKGKQSLDKLILSGQCPCTYMLIIRACVVMAHNHNNRFMCSTRNSA